MAGSKIVQRDSDVIGKALAKYIDCETHGILATGFRRDAILRCLERGHRAANRRDALVDEKDTRRLGCVQPAYGLQDSAAGEGYHRRSAGLRFERRDAEILLRGEGERACGAQRVAQHFTRHGTQEADVGWSACAY